MTETHDDRPPRHVHDPSPAPNACFSRTLDCTAQHEHDDVTCWRIDRTCGYVGEY